MTRVDSGVGGDEVPDSQLVAAARPVDGNPPRNRPIDAEPAVEVLRNRPAPTLKVPADSRAHVGLAAELDRRSRCRIYPGRRRRPYRPGNRRFICI